MRELTIDDIKTATKVIIAKEFPGMDLVPRNWYISAYNKSLAMLTAAWGAGWRPSYPTTGKHEYAITIAQLNYMGRLPLPEGYNGDYEYCQALYLTRDVLKAVTQSSQHREMIKEDFE